MYPQYMFNEAVLTCTHNICFEQKYENSKKNQLKIVIFTAVKNRCVLHGRVFVISLAQFFMLSFHLFLCLPLLFVPFIVPCRIVLAMREALEIRPYHLSLRFFNMEMT